ncbi:MAG TPA: GNAT family N-acetyltransferase, partial [Pyrinomonadaceae bacterium]|nr:GNAT family N-acetyltransferase [Pyrinomonadaceae bacterium]
TLDDAQFVLALVNEPSFVRYIGDKKVRTLDDARQYIQNGPLASYERNGFGLYVAELKTSHTPVGMCGLLKRDELPEPDIGFALLADFRKQGFGLESARAVLSEARESLHLQRILAITSLDNDASIALLQRLGFRLDRIVRLSPEAEELKLHAVDLR